MSTRGSSQSIMRRKPIEEMEEDNKSSGLFKSLGLWQLTAIGVGGIIGVGIFSLAGLVAHGDGDNPGVGPGVLIAFLIGVYKVCNHVMPQAFALMVGGRARRPRGAVLAPNGLAAQ